MINNIKYDNLIMNQVENIKEYEEEEIDNTKPKYKLLTLTLFQDKKRSK